MTSKIPSKSLKPEEIQKLAKFYEILIEIDRRNKIIQENSDSLLPA